MNITAKLNDYRQSPRKVRLVATLVKGKKVADALSTLTYAVKRAADPLKSLMMSAVANAKNNFNIEVEDLFVKDFSVHSGAILYRRMPRARGVAYPIRKRTSHVTLVLGVKEHAEAKKVKTSKVAKKKAVK